MTKDCLYRGQNCTTAASSKEHVINNSRRKLIQKLGADLGNEKARYKGITCNNCNRELGKHEARTWSELAIATMWKVVAGNINQVFINIPWARTTVTDIDTLTHYSDILRDALINEKVFPENMLTYDLEYHSITRSDGRAVLRILHAAEEINVFTDRIKITNTETNDEITRDVDIVMYHSHNANGSRLLFFLPLIPPHLSTPWGYTKIRVSHRGFGAYAQDYLEDPPKVTCRLSRPFAQTQQEATADRDLPPLKTDTEI
ncbi:MAG: hypothetical protein H6980_08845 [Gammaproteobacteria bacterium]|nr:hypothetical protein [Gammaproteobacteria bacterium]